VASEIKNANSSKCTEGEVKTEKSSGDYTQAREQAWVPGKDCQQEGGSFKGIKKKELAEVGGTADKPGHVFRKITRGGKKRGNHPKEKEPRGRAAGPASRGKA